MPNELEPDNDLVKPTTYQIKIKGHLGSEWRDWFERLTITSEDTGETVLTGPVVDQAALHGLLKRVRDLGMPLVSVSRVQLGPPASLPSALLGKGGKGPLDDPEVKS